MGNSETSNSKYEELINVLKNSSRGTNLKELKELVGIYVLKKKLEAIEQRLIQKEKEIDSRLVRVETLLGDIETKLRVGTLAYKNGNKSDVLKDMFKGFEDMFKGFDL